MCSSRDLNPKPFGMSPLATEIALEICQLFPLSVSLSVSALVVAAHEQSFGPREESLAELLDPCTNFCCQQVYLRIVAASRQHWTHTHKARGDFISRRSSRTMNMGGLALLLLVCMAVAVHYVIAALLVMEVSLLLWFFFANLFLLFVVSLSVVVCRCFVWFQIMKFLEVAVRGREREL